MNAITWFAKNGEEIVAPDFNVKSHRVNEALEAQIAYHISVGGTGNPGSDPQKGLKDNMPLADKIRIMRYIYGHRKDWGPCAVNMTWGNNGAIRGHSNRQLTYQDIKISHGYGAEDEGNLARSLILILRKGEVHKNRSDRDHQVSCWRHKNYLLCSVFSMAAYIIYNFSERCL